uniref:Snake toxin/toxin-like domain-containing protein n=1 Tax=Panagrolaimus sp. PS1159 TaxID=55785 RepID=A0AC35FV95_9BILA
MQRFLQSFLLLLLFLPFCLNLSCYSCTFSFNDVYDIDNHNAWCTNRTLLKISKDEVIKPCSAWEPWCITAITTTLNSFTSVTRACSVRCSTLCESIGYGQDQVTCADCCRTNNCNSNFSVSYYMNVMKRQHTSWTTPLQSERDFNKQHNFRFPY